MSTPLKPGSVQAHQLFLYSRAIHPGLLPIKNRRVTRHGEYELEVWAMDGGHLLRFERTTLCCCELLTAQETKLPEQPPAKRTAECCTCSSHLSVGAKP